MLEYQGINMKINFKFEDKQLNENVKIGCNLKLKHQDLDKIEKIIRPYKNKIMLQVTRLVDLLKKS